MSREDLGASSAGLVCGGGQEAPREMRRGKGGEKKRCGRAWREERRITFWRNDSRRGVGWVGDGRSFFSGLPLGEKKLTEKWGECFFGRIFFSGSTCCTLVLFFGKVTTSWQKDFFTWKSTFLLSFRNRNQRRGLIQNGKRTLRPFPHLLDPLPLANLIRLWPYRKILRPSFLPWQRDLFDPLTTWL